MAEDQSRRRSELIAENNGPAVVHGRSGRFLELALALFCGVDVFKNSEVESAVTNVHEVQLAANDRTVAF